MICAPRCLDRRQRRRHPLPDQRLWTRQGWRRIKGCAHWCTEIRNIGIRMMIGNKVADPGR